MATYIHYARATKASPALHIIRSHTSLRLLSSTNQHPMATISRTAAAEATIGAMLDDHAAGTRKRRRVGSTDDYKPTRVLGKGGFGIVVQARHRATGEEVALKRLVRSPDDGGGGKRRLHRDLLREACYLAACRDHPSVVGLHGIARDPGTGQCSLVLEHVGPSLGHVLRGRRRPFSEEATRRIMRQLLSGAGRIHQRGIVHRDIKPANILVGAEDVVKICDLGLAVSMASATPPRGRAGTRWYMAPEMLLGRPDYDELVDAWSLGCVMAELLAGEPLFPGQNAVDQLRRISRVLGGAGQHRGSGLRELFPEDRLSRDGFEVLDGLLTCDPGERLPAAVALRCPWFAGTGADVPSSAA